MNNFELAYRTRTHPRAKGVKLKIDKDGLVVVSRRPLSLKKYQEVLTRNRQWIETHLQKTNLRPSLESVSSFSLANNMYTLDLNDLYDFKVDNFVVKMQNTAKAKATFRKWLVRSAKQFLTPTTRVLAEQYNFKINRIIIKDQSTRWGSCSSKGNINLNWRLALAPDAVSKYVILHELAHTVHMNHSSSFWKLVEELQPDYKAAKAWLKAQGHTLYFI